MNTLLMSISASSMLLRKQINVTEAVCTLGKKHSTWDTFLSCAERLLDAAHL